MKGFTIVFTAIAIAMCQADDQVVLVPELPVGVWDGHCTVRKMTRMYDDCQNILDGNATDANRLACNLLKPNVVPLGGLSRSMSAMLTLGMFDADAIRPVFDTCVIPRLIQDGAIRIVKTTSEEALKSRFDTVSVGNSYDDGDLFGEGAMLTSYQMYSLSRARRYPDFYSLEAYEVYPAQIMHRYLHRDYKLKIDESVISKYIGNSVLQTLHVLLSEMREYQFDIKTLMHDKTYQSLMDDYLYFPTEFYLDQGIGSLVNIGYSHYSFYTNWGTQNQTAKQFAETKHWDASVVSVSAADYLYGGCTLDDVSSTVTIEDAIDACHKSSTLKPYELAPTSLAHIENLFDYLLDSAPAKAYPTEFKTLIDTATNNFLSCRCSKGSMTTRCRDLDNKYIDISLVTPCERNGDYMLRDLDFSLPLPKI